MEENISLEDALEEAYEKKLGEICREELVWAEKCYDKDHMDPWINGYMNALRTVLRLANVKQRRQRGEVKR